MNKNNNRSITLTVLFSVIMMIAFVTYSIYQLSDYEKGMTEIFAEEQDGYVALVAEEARRGSPVLESAEKAVGILDSSNKQYWTMDNKDTILYIKNVTESNAYRDVEPEKYYHSKSARKFLKSISDTYITHSTIEIDGKKYIASGTLVKTPKQSIRLILLSDYKILFSNNDYLSKKIYLQISIMVVASVFIVTLIFMAILIRNAKNRQDAAEKESIELRKKIEEISNIPETRKVLISMTPEEEKDESVSSKTNDTDDEKKNDVDDETICNIKEDVNDNAEKDTYDDKKDTYDNDKKETNLNATLGKDDNREIEEDKESDLSYARSKIINDENSIIELFKGIDERKIYPVEVIACKLEGIMPEEYYLSIKNILKRDAVWVSYDNSSLLLMFFKKNRDTIMKFVWNNVVYNNNIVEYKIFAISESDEALKIKENIEKFLGEYHD